MSEDFILNVQNNNFLRITAFGIEHIDSASCLIFVHGFKGFKDWGFGPYIGDYFSKKGFFVLTFNFSHNGVGDSLTDFVELDKFAENTFSGFFGNTSNQGIGLIGHSRGGAISILVGSASDDVKAVCTWSAVSNFNRYTKRQKDEWREKGFIEILNTRTKQKMKLNVSLLEDIEGNKEGSLNLEQAIKNMNKPLLIVQGKNDLAVPINEAEKMYDWSNKELTELLIIPNAGHTFDIKHPFEGSNNKFDSVINNTNKFFKTNLN